MNKWLRMQKSGEKSPPCFFAIDFLLCNRLLPIYFAESCCPIVWAYCYGLEYNAVAVFGIIYFIQIYIITVTSNVDGIFYILCFFDQVLDIFGVKKTNKG